MNYDFGRLTFFLELLGPISHPRIMQFKSKLARKEDL